MSQSSATLANGFLLKRSNDVTPTTFDNIGGFTTNSMTISRENTDITNKLSEGGFREYLAGSGLLSMSASGDGVFASDEAMAAAQDDILNRKIVDWQIIVPGNGTFEGLFSLTSLEFSGEQQGHVTYSISLESAGAIGFTPEA